MRLYILGSVFALFVTLFAGAPASAAGGLSAVPSRIVVSSEQNDVSLPLHNVPPVPPQSGGLFTIPLLQRPLSPSTLRSPASVSGNVFIASILGDPVVQGAPVDAVMPAPIRDFEGIHNVDGAIPPDPNGDVGPDHYVQWVNLSFAIYGKSGTLLYGPADGNTLWKKFGGPCERTNDGDPIVLYDHLADRWFFSQFALPNFPNGPFY